MPVLGDFRKLVELKLPSSGGKIWIYDYLLAKDSIEIDKIYVSETSISVNATKKQSSPISLRASLYYKALDATLEGMVAKWDFTDKEGKPIEPTVENLKQLPQADFDYLKAEIDRRTMANRLTYAEKKS